MIARLWWKETRTLWPAWPVLFGTAAGLQMILLASGSEEVQADGMLIAIALGWAALYAFVAASAAFAGEREAGTLNLLDALPVSRGTLWLGKTTFVLASTFGLTLVLLALGYLGSIQAWGKLPTLAEFVGQYGTLLFEAVAWGLLWSALVRNPMVAAALALACVGEVSYLASGGTKIEFISDTVIPARLVMAAFALGASAVVTVRNPLAGWSTSRWVGGDAARSTAARARAIRPRPASPARVLSWKARREGVGVWIAATAVGCCVLIWLVQANVPPEVGLPAALIGVGAAMVAGVAVFGGETAAGSHRFLLHLGVAPGPIWTRAMRVWGYGFAVTALIMLGLFSASKPGWWNRFDLLQLWVEQFQGFGRFARVLAIASALALVSPIANAFAVGTLAGMVFRRRITAGMITVIVWLAIAPLQVGLGVTGMLPPWALLFTPITLLGISRAWAGDWLDPRPGPARWLRLAGYMTIPTVLFSTVYIAYRAWGVADPGPVVAVARPRAPITSAVTDNDATAVQQQASMGSPSLPGMQATTGMTEPVTLESTWENILAGYRKARQVTGSDPNEMATMNALSMDTGTTLQALEWAASDKQTPKLLRKALKDLRDLPPFPTFGEVLTAEAANMERTLDLSGADLEVKFNGPRGRSAPVRILETMTLYPSWERERARRVCRAEFKRLIAEAAIESQPLPNLQEFEDQWEKTRRISPLATMFMRYGWFADSFGRAEAGRRGLVQVIALRAWSLSHQGTYPEKLTALVPDWLDHLPLDPFSGQPFGYTQSQGQKVPKLDLRARAFGAFHEMRPGQWLLYSVGPDRREIYTVAESTHDIKWPHDDLVFPLP